MLAVSNCRDNLLANNGDRTQKHTENELNVKECGIQHIGHELKKKTDYFIILPLFYCYFDFIYFKKMQ